VRTVESVADGVNERQTLAASSSRSEVHSMDYISHTNVHTFTLIAYLYTHTSFSRTLQEYCGKFNPLRKVHPRYRQTTDGIVMAIAERNVYSICRLSVSRVHRTQ